MSSSARSCAFEGHLFLEVRLGFPSDLLDLLAILVH